MSGRGRGAAPGGRGRGGYVSQPVVESESDSSSVQEAFDYEEYFTELPKKEQPQVAALMSLTKDTRAILEEQKDALAALELKLVAQLGPLMKRRAEIVQGLSEATPEEIAKGVPAAKPSKVEEIPTSDDEEEAKKAAGKKKVTVKDDKADKSLPEREGAGIPNFWLHCLKHNDVLDTMVMPHDEALLCYLDDIRLSYVDDCPRKGFQLEFDFADNEFMTPGPHTLKKSYVMDTEDDDGDVLDKAIGTPVPWKDEKSDLTVEFKEKVQRNKKTQQTRVTLKKESRASFFRFFYPPQLNDDASEDDEEEAEKQEQLESDYEAGMALFQVSKHAVKYFTKDHIIEILEQMENGEFGAYGDDDDEEDDEEDDEDDEEDSDDEEGGEPKAAKLPQQQECKQQ